MAQRLGCAGGPHLHPQLGPRADARILPLRSGQYESTPADQVDVWRFLRVYCLLSSAALAVFPATSVVTIVGFVRAGRMLYHRLLAAILNAPLRWSAEAGRIGRILSMFSLNLRVLDGLYILTLGTCVVAQSLQREA